MAASDRLNWTLLERVLFAVLVLAMIVWRVGARRWPVVEEQSRQAN